MIVAIAGPALAPVIVLAASSAPPPQVPEIPPIPPIPEVVIHDSSFWSGLPPWMSLFIALAMVAAGVVVLWPIVRALARAIDARTDRRLGAAVDVERLQERVAELEALHPRLAELEERLDFTERMLTRSPVGEAVRPGDA
jgi:hypothetical protein